MSLKNGKKIKLWRVNALLTGALFVIPALIVLGANLNLSSITIEAENGILSQGVSVISDSQASGAQALLFSNTQSTPSARPTRENTGPRYALTDITADQFYNTRTCNKQRIQGDVRIDQQWMKAQAFTLTDCEITGNFWVYIQGDGQQLPLNDMPIINMNYVDAAGLVMVNAAKLTVDHTYFATGGGTSLNDVWAPFVNGPAPITMSNSVFYAFMGNPANGDHVEALHAGDYGDGYNFTNVAFIQQGPMNGTQTATINFHGSNSVFDGCWFLFDGGVGAYYTVYIDGPNNMVKNSWFSAGAADYVYPDYAPNMQATYTNNRNIDTNELLNLP